MLKRHCAINSISWWIGLRYTIFTTNMWEFHYPVINFCSEERVDWWKMMTMGGDIK